MIYRPDQMFLLSREAASPQGVFRPGAIVRVEVLGTAAGGGTLVRIGGKNWTAANFSGYKTGDMLQARVRIEDGAVLLDPVSTDGNLQPARLSMQGNAAIFSRLGLPETPVAVYLASFFRDSGMKLDPVRMKRLLAIASRFPDQENEASEATAILEERGIEPSETTISRLLEKMTGSRSIDDNRTSSSNADSTGDGEHEPDDFLSFINTKKGSVLHWIIVPYTRSGQTNDICGSLRFLLDTESNTIIRTRITAQTTAGIWTFSLEGSSCGIGINPERTPAIFRKIIVYLKEFMTGGDVYPLESSVFPPSVDVEV